MGPCFYHKAGLAHAIALTQQAGSLYGGIANIQSGAQAQQGQNMAGIGQIAAMAAMYF